MGHRTGEKAGWIAGWAGTFSWVIVMTALAAAWGRTVYALALAGIAVLAALCIVRRTPWRHPDTRYWILFLPLYLLLAGAVGLCAAMAVAMGENIGNPMAWIAMFPLFIPFFTIGRRRWTDGEPKTIEPAGKGKPEPL